MKRVLIVDDHPIVLNGIKNTIEMAPDFEVAAALSSSVSALTYLKTLAVDILITDLEMPEMDGVSLIKRVKEEFNCKIIVLSMHDERSKLEEVMDLGVDGYLLKDSDMEDFVFALKSVAKGKQYFSPSLLETGIKPVNDSTSSDHHLTKREIEVLQLIAEGFSNKEVGAKLFLSPKTIDTHRTNLMKKLEVNNVVGLVRYALKEGIVK